MQNYENCRKQTKKKDGYHRSNNINKNNVNIKDIKTLYNIFSCNIQTESNIIDCTEKGNKHGSLFLTKTGKDNEDKKENYNNSINNNNKKKESYLFDISHDNYKITKTNNVKKEDDLFLKQSNKQKPKDNDFDFFMEYNENDNVNKLTKIKHLDKNEKEPNINNTINSCQSDNDSLLFLNEIDVKKFENFEHFEHFENFEKFEKNINTELGYDKIVHYNQVEKIKEQKGRDVTINKTNDIFIVDNESQKIDWEKKYDIFDKEFEKNTSFDQNEKTKKTKQNNLDIPILFDNNFCENKQNNCPDLGSGYGSGYGYDYGYGSGLPFCNKVGAKNETEIDDKISDHIDLDTYPSKEIINLMENSKNEKNEKNVSFPFDLNSNIFPKTNYEDCIYNSLAFNDKDSELFNTKDKNILDISIDKNKETIYSSEYLVNSNILFNLNYGMFEKEGEDENKDAIFKDVKKSQDDFFLSENLNKNEMNCIFDEVDKTCYKTVEDKIESYPSNIINKTNISNNENNMFLEIIKEIESVSKDLIHDNFKLESGESVLESGENVLESGENVLESDMPSCDNKMEIMSNNKSVCEKDINKSAIHFDYLKNIDLQDMNNFTQIQFTDSGNKTIHTDEETEIRENVYDKFEIKNKDKFLSNKADETVNFYDDIYNILINKNYLDTFLILKKNKNINNEDINNFHIYLKNVKKKKKRGFSDMYDYNDYIYKFIEEIYSINVNRFFFYNIYIDNINKCIKKKNLLINNISNSYNFVNDFYKKNEKLLTHDMFYKNINYSFYFLNFINILIKLWKKITIKIKNINIMLLLKKFVNIFKKNKIIYAIKEIYNYLCFVYNILNKPILDEKQTKIKKIIKIIIKSQIFKMIKKYVYKINNSSFHFIILFSLISIPPYKKTCTIFDHFLEYFFKNINKILLKRIKDTFTNTPDQNGEQIESIKLTNSDEDTNNLKHFINNIIKTGKNNICLVKIKNLKQIFLQNVEENKNNENTTNLLDTLTDIKINEKISLIEKELELYIKYNISFYRLFFKFIIPLINKITTIFENLETFFTLYIKYKIKKKKKLFFFYDPWIYSYDTFLSFSQINIIPNLNNLKKNHVFESDNQEFENFSNQIKTNIYFKNSKDILNWEQFILYHKQLENDLILSNIFNSINKFYDYKNISEIISYKENISTYYKKKDLKKKISFNLSYNKLKNYYTDILNLCYDEKYIKINTRALKYLFFNLYFN
ncbi:hypothetical protein YYC_03990 [Plasmodium yoelii 17X]|uniref:Uncharacterized protein n=1 Tax=Plasmodium yoelii 17X TaxID=1323249 RepID=V7PH86_PLAYE|nr:hypothetical protein YYC_03990 [Plasmodium yoelii 17X]